MATRMQQRRGTAAQWISTNNGSGPILEAGEIGFETDTNKFKIGDGVNHWVDLQYFTDAASINTAISNLVDGAPALLNTLNELADAINNDPSFFTTIATNLSNHESDTTNIHGIANTADLATKSYADDAVSTHSSDTTDVHGISDTAELATKTFAAELLTNATKSNITITGDKNGLTITAENGVADSDTDDLVEGTTNKYFTNQRALDATSAAYDPAGSAVTAQSNAEDYADGLAVNYDAAGTASSAVSSHNSSTTNVHGILDTADLATQQYVQDAVSNAEVDQSTLAGIGIDWSGTQFDIDSTVTTNDGTQTLTNKTISYTNNTITVQAANVSDLTATALELNTLDGITADVNELNVLDGITSSTAELNILDGVTATTAEINILDGATLDVTELNYLDGVTSSVQTQLDDKLSKAGGTMTGDLTLAGAPTQSLHAATKAYVDGVTEGLHIHEAVKAATTANITLASDVENGDTLDGVTLATGDRILVKNQTTKSENGIYVVAASGAPTRALDFDTPAEIDSGDFVFVDQGTTNGNTGWVQINVVGTVGTDDVEFTQFSGAGTFLAGTGLDLDGNTFSIDTATTVDVSTAQTLTNKTISAANNTLTIATTDLTNVTASAAEVNILDGATLDTAELNVLDGITATTAELNILDGVTATTSELNVLDGITANTSELNILNGATLSTTELNYVDGVTSAIQTQLDGKVDESVITAKGDLYVGSANATVDNLAVGTNGYLLTADSNEVLGVKWAAAPVSLPSQTGNSGKYLTTDGTDASWATLVVPITTGTATITGNTATTIDAPYGAYAFEYTIRLKQGSKVRTSKVIMQTDSISSADMTEYAITETGGTMSGVLVSTSFGIAGAELNITVTDASSTNVDVKFSKVVL